MSPFLTLLLSILLFGINIAAFGGGLVAIIVAINFFSAGRGGAWGTVVVMTAGVTALFLSSLGLFATLRRTLSSQIRYFGNLVVWGLLLITSGGYVSLFRIQIADYIGNSWEWFNTNFYGDPDLPFEAIEAELRELLVTASWASLFGFVAVLLALLVVIRLISVRRAATIILHITNLALLPLGGMLVAGGVLLARIGLADNVTRTISLASMGQLAFVLSAFGAAALVMEELPLLGFYGFLVAVLGAASSVVGLDALLTRPALTPERWLFVERYLTARFADATQASLEDFLFFNERVAAYLHGVFATFLIIQTALVAVLYAKMAAVARYEHKRASAELSNFDVFAPRASQERRFIDTNTFDLLHDTVRKDTVRFQLDNFSKRVLNAKKRWARVWEGRSCAARTSICFAAVLLVVGLLALSLLLPAYALAAGYCNQPIRVARNFTLQGPHVLNISVVDVRSAFPTGRMYASFHNDTSQPHVVVTVELAGMLDDALDAWQPPDWQLSADGSALLQLEPRPQAVMRWGADVACQSASVWLSIPAWQAAHAFKPVSAGIVREQFTEFALPEVKLSSAGTLSVDNGGNASMPALIGLQASNRFGDAIIHGIRVATRGLTVTSTGAANVDLRDVRTQGGIGVWGRGDGHLQVNTSLTGAIVGRNVVVDDGSLLLTSEEGDILFEDVDVRTLLPNAFLVETDGGSVELVRLQAGRVAAFVPSGHVLMRHASLSGALDVSHGAGGDLQFVDMGAETISIATSAGSIAMQLRAFNKPSSRLGDFRGTFVVTVPTPSDFMYQGGNLTLTPPELDADGNIALSEDGRSVRFEGSIYCKDSPTLQCEREGNLLLQTSSGSVALEVEER